MDYSTKIKNGFKKGAEQVLRILYPSLCAHCEAPLSKRMPLFCSTCLEQVSLVETQGRCPICFAELYKHRCERCMHRPVVIHRQMAACEAFGPSKTMANELQNGNQQHIPGIAALMAYRWLETNIPLPDFLIPLPLPFWQKQRHGFDANLLLSKELSKILGIPTHPILKRRFDRDHFLTQCQWRFRFELKKKNKESLCDKRLLLIALKLDDAAFRLAGSEMKAYFPTQIDALAFVGAV
jgi:predicted amidophosphoribosyltransferase